MGAVLTIILVFWVQLGLGLVVVGSGGPRPDGSPACGYSEMSQNPLRHSSTNNLFLCASTNAFWPSVCTFLFHSIFLSFCMVD
jgi:hypothetical protein